MKANQWRCVACGGVYMDQSETDIVYLHICPDPLPKRKGVKASELQRRDETPIVNELTKERAIRAAGEGVECLSDGKMKEPSWITRMVRLTRRKERETDA